MKLITSKRTASSQKSVLHFARFEFKYILSALVRAEVEDELRNFLNFDPYVEQMPDNKYLVRSLYFDDPVYSAFYDKVDGLHSRSKFRLRTYCTDDDGSSAAFLEIKGRHNSLVYKHRVPVSRENGSSWCSLGGASLSSALLLAVSSGPVREQFQYALLRKNISPIAVIDYLRRPYVSKYDPSFRITFDEKLMATKSDRLFFDGRCSPRKVVAGFTIMEVKFRHHMPAWFHRIIQVHELRRVSISKICSGMEVLGMATDTN